MFRGVPVAIFSLFVASSAVRAGPLYMATVAGEIDFVQDTGSGDVFADVVFVGDRFELTYIFDDIPDEDTGLHTLYDIDTATLRIGQVVFQHSGIRDVVGVGNDHPPRGDSYISAVSFTFAANEFPYPVAVSLRDTTSTVFSDTSMPLSIDLNRFDVTHFGVYWNELFVESAPALISGQVDSLTIQLIPEPSTFVLLGIVWAMMSRRRLS